MSFQAVIRSPLWRIDRASVYFKIVSIVKKKWTWALSFISYPGISVLPVHEDTDYLTIVIPWSCSWLRMSDKNVTKLVSGTLKSFKKCKVNDGIPKGSLHGYAPSRSRPQWTTPHVTARAGMCSADILAHMPTTPLMLPWEEVGFLDLLQVVLRPPPAHSGVCCVCPHTWHTQSKQRNAILKFNNNLKYSTAHFFLI